MNTDLKTTFSDKRIVGLTLLGVLLFLLAAGSVLVGTQLKDSFVLYQEEQQMLDSRLGRLQYLSLLAANDEQTREITDTYRKMLPIDSSQSEFLERIEQLRNDYKVTVPKVQFQAAMVRGVAQYMPVNLEATGAYGDVMQFLNDLCYGARLVTLDTISLSGNSDQVTARVTIAPFYQLLEVPAPAPAAETPAA